MVQGLLSMLVTFIFNIVASIANFMISPFINAVLLIFPNLTARFLDLTYFFNSAFTYVACILRWFLFTPLMFFVLFDYFAVKFSVFVLTASIRCGINVYNKLKP